MRGEQLKMPLVLRRPRDGRNLHGAGPTLALCGQGTGVPNNDGAKAHPPAHRGVGIVMIAVGEYERSRFLLNIALCLDLSAFLLWSTLRDSKWLHELQLYPRQRFKFSPAGARRSIALNQNLKPRACVRRAYSSKGNKRHIQCTPCLH